MNLERIFDRICSRIETSGLSVEGIAVMDADASVICEKRWTPNLPRDIYSNTKSFVGLAIGMAVWEGKLTLDDRVIDWLPDSLPEAYSPMLEQIRLRHLLTMSSGFDKGLLMYPSRRKGIGCPDYLRYILSHKVEAIPGTKYCYSSADAILAGRICEQATGKGLALYLYERFFQKAGIQYPIWEHCPMGHACGASGLHLTLPEMMKLGVLYLNYGIFHNQQLVAEEWVRESAAKQFHIPGDNPWSDGYGYFFKTFADCNCYRASGVYGQETIVVPEKHMVIGIQCAENTDFSQIRIILEEEFFHPENIY